MTRVGWVFWLLFFASTLQACVIEVSGSFTIAEVTRKEGKIVLPSERSYQNIRILDRSTYDFVLSCAASCVQPLTDVVPVVADVRSAKMRAGMWIVSVSFSRAWLVTFLVFQKGNDFDIKPPKNFRFLDDKLALKTRKVILETVRQKNR